MTNGPTVLTNLNAATLIADAEGYGLIPDAAIVLDADKICWIGPRHDLPKEHLDASLVDLGGRLATPSLIDCHTHIVYGGSRAREFEMRLNGATYEEIARTGGGIRSTVAATRAASEEQLLAEALPRVDALLGEGVTLLEIKSGYGLDLATELKMLRVARKIGELRPVQVLTTFLGAHALPPEYEAGAMSTSLSSVMTCSLPHMPKIWQMQLTRFVRASPSHLSKCPVCLTALKSLVCQLKFTPSNFPTWAAQLWLLPIRLCLPIILNIWIPLAFRP